MDAAIALPVTAGAVALAAAGAVAGRRRSRERRELEGHFAPDRSEPVWWASAEEDRQPQ